ncbi:hypothetical protein D9V32_11670 [Mycetocola tolaasinivorans]|uniref:Uncharacterized protein n=1 Tax=Mycetocola tolaasinivorans TaxID=76635 RepID=A0A3L7A684_9MICO|nr:hypothetical protein [Mycetocola tolaasinivorans]RLP75071.1 hypothetical protein D9V32_11670 [Mycetocola tolaasinivorans]
MSILTLILTGCAKTDGGRDFSGDGDSTAEISAAQRAILEREQIGFDEYKEAWANYTRCTEDAGYRITEVALSPTDSRRYHGMIEPVPGQKQDTQRELACAPDELSYVEEEYMRQNPPFIDPVLLAEIFARLERAGISFTGNETKIADFFPNVSDENRISAITEIITDTTREMFPDAPFVSVGF